MIRTFFFYIFIIIYLPCLGQISYIFNRFSRNEGLNTNNVNCVWQDKNGYLWIGTENGIQRFDARKFNTFSSTTLNRSLPPSGVDQILDAGNGKMWIRQDNLVGLFDPAAFTYVNVPVVGQNQLPTESALTLFVDSKGNTFLCTHKTGLLYFNEAENQFTYENLPIRIPEGWFVNSLFEDTVTSNYWICSDKGLALYESKTGTLFSQHNNPQNLPILDHEDLNFIYRFFISKNRTYWMIKWDYSPEIEPVLICYNPSTHEVLNDIKLIQKTGTEYQGPFWINETRNGQIWCGGVNTLISYDFKLNTFIQHKKINPDDHDIRFREIKHVFEDREGNIWLSTNNGVYVLTPGQTSAFNVALKDLNQGRDIVINSILEIKDSENWIGTWENGIIIFDKEFNKTDVDLYNNIHGENLINYKKVWDLHQHSESGYIWSGCQNGLMAIFDPKTKTPVALLEPAVFEHTPIRQILEDRKGNLFFGTQKGRLAKWNKGTGINNKSFDIIRDFHSAIYVLYRDNEDRIWVGTRDLGLFVMDVSGQKVLYQFNEQPGSFNLLGNNVFDVVQYNDSIFFVSTGIINILNLNSEEIQTLSQYNELPGGGITRMLIDEEGILWFPHNNGLGSYNYGKNIFISYNEKSGIIMADKSTNAKFKMHNGEFWFGGENELFGFLPDGLKLKTAPPDVTITDFKLFNTFIQLDSILALKKIRLKPDQNSLTFYFSSLSYSQQDKLLYYYKMDGADKDWIKAERELAANYSTLTPGDYTFNVKCINMQGVESANITTLELTILPRFYQTWWFVLIIILFFGGLTFTFYHQRLTKLLAVERIRNKVARDLHDDVGSTLSTINILSSMAKTKLLTDPVKTSEYISKITDNSQYMMEAMDDIVWSIKPNNDNMQKIIARMREYASSILEPKDIDIHFSVDENIFSLKLDMETRRDMFLIFKEAINNSAKYSQCSEIEIRLNYENKKLTVSISDNGKGFDVQKADSGNGLGNMTKRAEALHGSITIQSKEGNGTHIILLVPVTG
jgi:signal transduction histidine kinase/ligand-binding sensor domain-containing protein